MQHMWIQFGRHGGRAVYYIPNWTDENYSEIQRVPDGMVLVTNTLQKGAFPGELPDTFTNNYHIAFINILERYPEEAFRQGNELYRVVPTNFDLKRIWMWPELKQPRHNDSPNYEKFYYRYTDVTDGAWFIQALKLLTENRELLVSVPPEFNLNRFSSWWSAENLLVNIEHPHNIISKIDSF